MIEKKSKVGQPSGRQGGEYTQAEVDLWSNIESLSGRKKHLASFTNTESGKVKVYQQDRNGKLINKVLEEPIPDFEIKKQLIKQHFGE